MASADSSVAKSAATAAPARRGTRFRWWLWAVLAGVVLCVGLNRLAYVHARSMLTYADGGMRTRSPEKLGVADKVGLALTGIRLPRPVLKRTPEAVGLNYTTVALPGGDADSSRTPALELWQIAGESERPVVVMFHGYSACKSDLLDEAALFAETGCSLLLVDFRGSGGSEGNTTTLGFHEAEDVARVWKYAREWQPGHPILLYGKSMGSAAILRAVAHLSAAPDGVILECPFDRLLSTVENRFQALRVPAFPMARLLVFWGGVQQGMDGFAHNPVDYATQVKCPTLLLHGARDPRVTVAELESIYGQLPGEKELVLFPEAGHESYVGVDAERWRRVIADFCARY
ncbi:MAG: alpha/beta fold hydrolase [Planctomycetes bacterium]|nr:alpha/beta fold hydrolase [Planctomycetota bacterium]